ncbi:MAG: cupin domain-containing protein [Myxococcota bacterium]
MIEPKPALVRPMTEVAETPVERSRGASIQVLIGPDEGAPRFFTRRFTLQPGGRIPKHRHEDIEHEQVVLEGEMVLGLDDEERVVRAGDTVFIPAGVAHWYENRSGAPMRFLCVVPRSDNYQTEWLESAAE